MATLKRQFLGQLSGTLGDTVHRIRNGKPVVSLRPGKYKISKSEAAKKGRNTFALSVAFAKAINNISELKQIWQIAKLEGFIAYNRIIKYNKKIINSDGLTTKNIITPIGIFFNITSLEITSQNLQLKISLDEEPLKNLLQPPFMIYYVLYINIPNDNLTSPFQILARSAAIIQTSENDKLNLTIEFDVLTKQLLLQYKRVICYTAASALDDSKKEIKWTSTVAKEFAL